MSGSRRTLGVLVLGVILLGAVLVGCGGSVADADSRAAAPATRPVPTEVGPFCSAVRANADAVRPLNGLSLRTPVAADQLTAAVQAARLSGTVLLDAAPGAIRADVQRTVDALDVELNALLAAGGDPAAAARDPQVAALMKSAEVSAAGTRVATYVSQNCGQPR